MSDVLQNMKFKKMNFLRKNEVKMNKLIIERRIEFIQIIPFIINIELILNPKSLHKLFL